MADSNLIYDFDREDDVYNRDVYHYLLNMNRLKMELEQLKRDNLAFQKMIHMFEKHEAEYNDKEKT